MFQVMKKATAAVLVAAAISAPAASARPIDPVRPPVTIRDAGNRVADSGIDSSNLPPAQTSSDDFDWGDAGIGAAAVFTVLGLGTGALLVGRRSRERRPAATS